MKNKGKALAWVALYAGIGLALQLVMGFIMAGTVYGIALSEGLIGDPDVMLELFERAMGAGLQSDSVSISGAVAMAVTALCDFIMLILFGLWYYFRESKYPFRPNYRKALRPANILAVCGIAFFGQFATSLVLAGFQILFPTVFRQYEELAQSFNLDTITPLLMIFIVGLLGPLAEEMLFRGMIYAKLRRAFSVWPAAVISAVLFGLFHANWVQGIYAALFGVVLAYIYEKTQTIWGSCLLHVVFNSISYLVEWLMGLIPGDSIAVGIVMLLFDLASAVLVILLMRRFRNETGKA